MKAQRPLGINTINNIVLNTIKIMTLLYILYERDDDWFGVCAERKWAELHSWRLSSVVWWTMCALVVLIPVIVVAIAIRSVRTESRFVIALLFACPES